MIILHGDDFFNLYFTKQSPVMPGYLIFSRQQFSKYNCIENFCGASGDRYAFKGGRVCEKITYLLLFSNENSRLWHTVRMYNEDLLIVHIYDRSGSVILRSWFLK